MQGAARRRCGYDEGERRFVVNHKTTIAGSEVGAENWSTWLRLIATRGTREFLEKHGIEAQAGLKVHEGRPNIVDLRTTTRSHSSSYPLGRSASTTTPNPPHACSEPERHYDAIGGSGLRRGNRACRGEAGSSLVACRSCTLDSVGRISDDDRRCSGPSNSVCSVEAADCVN